MSTSSASETVSLSIVVASNGAPDSVARCLDALAPQRDGVEVIVVTPDAVSGELRDSHPDVTWLERTGALVPVLWRDGIRAATGESVALTISPMVPAHDWVDALAEVLDQADAVGGAVEPGAGLRLSDRAEHLSRYARDILPFDRHECLELPGDNAAYRRALLDQVALEWADGFLEPSVHRALDALGARLVHDPRIVVRMGRSAGARAFVHQRWAHGREHAERVGRDAPRSANLVRVAASPIVPFLLLARTAREVIRRRRLRGSLVASLPLLLVYDVAWAAGEAAGYLDAVRNG
jgi:hypothetical protein